MLQITIRLPIVVCQRKVDGLDAVLVLLALAGVAEASDSVVRLDLQFCLQRADKGAEHVQQHALATLLQYFQDLHIHQCGEHDRLLAVDYRRMVYLAHRLVRLVGRVDEGQSDVAGLHLELRKYGVAESLCGDAGAVRDEENGSIGHGWRVGFGRRRSCSKWRWHRGCTLQW